MRDILVAGSYEFSAMCTIFSRARTVGSVWRRWHQFLVRKGCDCYLGCDGKAQDVYITLQDTTSSF
jgi:hypothetical protein